MNNCAGIVMVGAPEHIGKDGHVANLAEHCVRHFQRIIHHLMTHVCKQVLLARDSTVSQVEECVFGYIVGPNLRFGGGF